MKPSIHPLSAVLPSLLALSLACPGAVAQDAAKTTDLLDVSCADYLEALALAQAGDDASAERKEDAAQAQDDIVSAMLWLHGYTSARQPAGAAFPPLTEAWISDAVVRVAKACETHSPDGRMRLADAATKP